MRTAVLIALLAAPFTANAILINVEYSGTVNSAQGLDGAGYSFGDAISGTLQIDTDLAPADIYPGIPSWGTYYNYGVGNSNFVTGYAPDEVNSLDQIVVEDDYNSGRDSYFVGDNEEGSYDDGAGNYGHSYKYSYIYVSDDLLDFITGDGIAQQFVLTADGPGVAYGFVQNESYAYENYQRTAYHSGYAYFTLDHLAVGPASVPEAPTPVPEPASLVLLGAGLAFVGFGRAIRAVRCRRSRG